MKKMIIFLCVIAVLFIAIALITSYQQEEKVQGNPYGKKNLDQSTIDQLDDPNYQNLILPAELANKLRDKKDATVYFYSPTCPHCQKATPIVAPLAEKMGIDLEQYNLLEFEQGWDDYKIESTPTIVFYKNGKEVDRLVGQMEEKEYKEWFEKNGIN
ncbi:thioredoxin family protein [Peribacillus sp. SCS-155]|uniref:thioredoxin family protein n=1 Tax=Peribacillus sedimenti TaxID=3115297 RepID=UPI00390629A5